MNNLEELFDFNIKPELPYGEMVAFKNGFGKVEYIGDLSFEMISCVYNTEFPRAYYQVVATDYSKIDIPYCSFWAKPFKFLENQEPVIYPHETYDKKARVPFMFKLAIPDEWLVDLDLPLSTCAYNRYYFPFFTYPCSEYDRNVEKYLKEGHTLIKTGKQYDGWDEFEISDTKEKVIKVVHYKNWEHYYLVQPIPFCKVGNYFVSPLLSEKDVSEDKINEHMQEIWNSSFDKKLFLETMKKQLQKSFTWHLLKSEIQGTKELKPLTLTPPMAVIRDKRFEKPSTREISDYAILTGGLGLVNMHMVHKFFSEIDNFIEGRGIPECSYLNSWDYVRANWALENVSPQYTGTIFFMNNFDFSFLGLRLGFIFNSLEETFTKVEGNIGWLKEEAPQTVLNDGYQELFEKAYQKDLLEKTDTYFTNPKTKEKQRVYHAFGIKAIRVIPSFYEAESFYHHLSNGNVYRPDYKKPIWVRVEPIECLIKENYAEFRKILVAGLPIKIKEEDLEKIKEDYRNHRNIYGMPKIENEEELSDFVNNVFAKEISRVSELVPYYKVHKDDVGSRYYELLKQDFPEDARPYSLMLSLKKKTTKDYLDEKRG